jgi:multiple sugar transport system substrate-binding protein
MYEGDIYGIPKDFSVLGMFYNKEMFKKAGIREVPDTWDELLAVAKKLKKAGLVPMSVSSDLSTWLAFIYQKGAEIITPDYKHSLFTDPRIVESLEFYALFWV